MQWPYRSSLKDIAARGNNTGGGKAASTAPVLQTGPELKRLHSYTEVDQSSTWYGSDHVCRHDDPKAASMHAPPDIIMHAHGHVANLPKHALSEPLSHAQRISETAGKVPGVQEVQES